MKTRKRSIGSKPSGRRYKCQKCLKFKRITFFPFGKLARNCKLCSIVRWKPTGGKKITHMSEQDEIARKILDATPFYGTRPD